MTDEKRMPDPIAAARRQPKGGGIIFRNYDDPYRNERAIELRQISKERSLCFIVAGDLSLALSVGAEGCHLPEHLHHLIPRARMAKPDLLVTAAAHSFKAILSAEKHGADAALVSPVFATESHAEAAPLGPLRLASWANQTALPLYALGGVNRHTARRIVHIPLAGLAGISGL